MHPLVYLFTKSFTNGLKRSVTSPKRMISLIVFGLYYYLVMFRAYVSPHPYANVQRLPVQLSLPDTSVLDGSIFAIMSLASLFMLAGVLSYRGGFRPADVDVLFPTPVSPRVVLVFRILRDYLLTLLAPLLFSLLGWRGASLGLQALFAKYPAHAGDVLRMTWVAWMLMSLGWVALGYGFSMFVNRSDLASDRNRLIITGAIGALVVVVLGYVGFSLKQNLSWDTALQLSHSPLVRVLMFPATAATAVVMGSFEGNWLMLGSGLLGAAAIVAAGMALALTQVSWLYDQAAARGFDAINMRKLRRSGDTFGILAERARAGKLGKGRLAKRLSTLTMSGTAALIWKDLVLQARSTLSGFPLIGLACIGANLFVLYITTTDSLSGRGSGAGIELSIGASCAYLFGVVSANGGAVEFLRRVDLLKPLPFTSTKIVLGEVLGKLPIIFAIIFFAELAGIVMRPEVYPAAISSMVLGPCAASVIISSVVLSIVLFPDLDDPTQRGLRGLLMLLAMVIGSVPGAALFLGLAFELNVPMLLATIPAALVMLGITVAMSAVSGWLYAGYNPSE